MKVSDWLLRETGKTTLIRPHQSIRQVLEIFLQQPALRDLYVVGNDGRVQGHLPRLRLARLLLAEHLPMQSSRQIMERVCGGPIGEIMERDFVSARADEELDNVIHRLLEYNVDDMPVIDAEHRLVGNINLLAIMHASAKGEL